MAFAVNEAALDAAGRPDPAKFAASHIARITPLVESLGKWPKAYGVTTAKDFSFEREWRFLGDFHFPLFRVAAVVVAAGDADSFSWDLWPAVWTTTMSPA